MSQHKIKNVRRQARALGVWDKILETRRLNSTKLTWWELLFLAAILTVIISNLLI
jgi:hypothetical protein